jgi:raffinose/stachyose/melibiose transport system permease protein
MHRKRAVLILVITLAVTALWMLPVLHALGRSLSPPDGIGNYIKVLQDVRLPRYFINSAVVSLSVITLVVISASLAAFAFSKLTFPFKNVLFFVLLITLLVPFSTMIVPLFVLVRSLGLYNNYLGLILPQVAFSVPFYTVLIRNYFDSLPNELIGAAYIDGCTDFGVFWRVMMPLSLPVQTVVITLVFWGPGTTICCPCS